MIIFENQTSQPYTRVTTLGNIGYVNTHNDDDSPQKEESTIKMSEKNFRVLLSLIPKTNEYNAVKNTIQRIKNKLTEMNFMTTAELNRDLLITYLKDTLEYEEFIKDVEEFNADSIAIVGRIDLEEVIDETMV
jgi:hypothetical protein